jgi:seryl-tRNA synthetase
MVDLSLLRENPEMFTAVLKKKDPHYDVDQLLFLDKKVRSIRSDVENLRSQKNELAKKGREGITPELRAQSAEISNELKNKENELVDVEQAFQQLYLMCPNLPHDSVPVGTVEDNLIERYNGTKPTYDFPLKNHVELGEKLGWLDFEAATKLAGTNFALYKGDGVRLLYALAMFMLKHNNKHGFDFVLPSVLLNEKSLEVTGNFPRFKDQAFALPEDNLFLTPTSEVNLTNMYRDQIIMKKDLPVRMTAFTSCFRREGGGYGANERGLIRMRQFEKVELVSICAPEESWNEHARMLACAEEILQRLGLHYRILVLATQDMSFSSAKTYDIEVWCPGQNEYKEIASVSNCTDFQARRGMIRFKDKPEDKTQLVHTLNGSSLALPRLMVALMETYQQPDGSIKLPDILKNEGLF